MKPNQTKVHAIVSQDSGDDRVDDTILSDGEVALTVGNSVDDRLELHMTMEADIGGQIAKLNVSVLVPSFAELLYIAMRGQRPGC